MKLAMEDTALAWGLATGHFATNKNFWLSSNRKLQKKKNALRSANGEGV